MKHELKTFYSLSRNSSGKEGKKEEKNGNCKAFCIKRKRKNDKKGYCKAFCALRKPKKQQQINDQTINFFRPRYSAFRKSHKVTAKINKQSKVFQEVATKIDEKTFCKIISVSRNKHRLKLS